jgi:hypothetical protein
MHGHMNVKLALISFFLTNSRVRHVVLIDCMELETTPPAYCFA